MLGETLERIFCPEDRRVDRMATEMRAAVETGSGNGAILVTGFAGGALAAHLRVTQELIWPEVVNVALTVGAWGGLWLRDLRVRALLPLH